MKLIWVATAIAFLLTTACETGFKSTAGPPSSTGPLQPDTATAVTPSAADAAKLEPYWPTADWRSAPPEAAGMDKAALDRVMSAVQSSSVNALLVVRKGYLVAEYYKPGRTRDSLMDLNSVTKSFTSALIGITLGEGKIRSVDQPAADFYPEMLKGAPDARKQAMTVGHLLSMTSGIDWPEWGHWTVFERMQYSPNWIDYVLARGMSDEPGRVFNYNSGGSHLLTGIVHRTHGEGSYDFAVSRLLKPVGISHFSWPRDPQGIITGGHGMMMTARDAAKFGYLYLRGGEWEGTQIVPKSWVSLSQSQHSGGNDVFGAYGYHWWLRTLPGASSEPVPYGMGADGQFVLVLPKHDMVIVMLSAYPTEDTAKPLDFVPELVHAIKTNP